MNHAIAIFGHFALGYIRNVTFQSKQKSRIKRRLLWFRHCLYGFKFMTRPISFDGKNIKNITKFPWTKFCQAKGKKRDENVTNFCIFVSRLIFWDVTKDSWFSLDQASFEIMVNFGKTYHDIRECQDFLLQYGNTALEP